MGADVLRGSADPSASAARSQRAGREDFTTILHSFSERRVTQALRSSHY